MCGRKIREFIQDQNRTFELIAFIKDIVSCTVPTKYRPFFTKLMQDIATDVAEKGLHGKVDIPLFFTLLHSKMAEAMPEYYGLFPIYVLHVHNSSVPPLANKSHLVGLLEPWRGPLSTSACVWLFPSIDCHDRGALFVSR